MHVLLTIPHGFALRNAVYSTLPDVLAQDQVTAVAAPAMHSALPSAWHAQAWPTYRESARAGVLRRAVLTGHMRVHATPGMQRALPRQRGTTRLGPRRLLDEMGWQLGKTLRTPQHLYTWTQRLERAHRASSTTAAWRAILASQRPEVILCGDQRRPEHIPLRIAARDVGIPCGTVIFSWDNLSSKGRMPCGFDFYLVWSAHMAHELRRFYPEVPTEAIHVTGTPQFEAYLSSDRVRPRAEFAASIGADPAVPWLAFCGEGPLTYPDSPQFVSDLVGSSQNLQILLRPTPSDTSERWRSVVAAQPGRVLWCPPKWQCAQSWEQALPSEPDMAELANLAHHCAACVNIASTLTLDFAIAGKPSINLAYDTTTPPPLGRPLWEHYFQYDHYRPIVELGAATIVRQRDQLGAAIQAILATPDATLATREQLIQMQTDNCIFDVGQRIRAELGRRSAG